jgi:hypothetical protein
VHDLTKSQHTAHAGNAQAVAQERVVTQGGVQERCRKQACSGNGNMPYIYADATETEEIPFKERFLTV